MREPILLKRHSRTLAQIKAPYPDLLVVPLEFLGKRRVSRRTRMTTPSATGGDGNWGTPSRSGVIPAHWRIVRRAWPMGC